MWSSWSWIPRNLIPWFWISIWNSELQIAFRPSKCNMEFQIGIMTRDPAPVGNDHHKSSFLSWSQGGMAVIPIVFLLHLSRLQFFTSFAQPCEFSEMTRNLFNIAVISLCFKIKFVRLVRSITRNFGCLSLVTFAHSGQVGCTIRTGTILDGDASFHLFAWFVWVVVVDTMQSGLEHDAWCLWFSQSRWDKWSSTLHHFTSFGVQFIKFEWSFGFLECIPWVCRQKVRLFCLHEIISTNSSKSQIDCLLKVIFVNTSRRMDWCLRTCVTQRVVKSGAAASG